jgi:hypothetical protein
MGLILVPGTGGAAENNRFPRAGSRLLLRYVSLREGA